MYDRKKIRSAQNVTDVSFFVVHVTHYGLLIKQDGLIEVLLFLCMEPVVHNSPSPSGIWIRLSP